MKVELKNIQKSYGENIILNDFNLEIKSGEMVALVGPSGAGKSTIMNIIGLLEKADSGDVCIGEVTNPEGKEVTILLRNEIGYLFQNFALIDNETVEKNLDVATKFLNISGLEKSNRKLEVLKKVGLEKNLKSKVYELSGGEQQRIALARLMLKSCNLVLCDEPTGSLDDVNKNQVMALLKEMNENGKTVVIVTHDDAVANTCDRIIKIV